MQSDRKDEGWAPYKDLAIQMGQECRKETHPFRNQKSSKHVTATIALFPCITCITKRLAAWPVKHATSPRTAACWMGGRMLMVFSHLMHNSSQMANRKPWPNLTLANNLC